MISGNRDSGQVTRVNWQGRLSPHGLVCCVVEVNSTLRSAVARHQQLRSLDAERLPETWEAAHAFGRPWEGDGVLD